MARIRTIKPEFFTSEDVMSQDPLGRLLFIGLLCEADREGRMKWTPQSWKARYLPGDDCDIGPLIDALVTRGLLVKYASGTHEFGFIPTFTIHQVINPRERESAVPPPPNGTGRKEGTGKEQGTASVTRGYTREFETFWESYPNRKGKGAAEKAWRRIKPDEALAEKILAAIEKQKISPEWIRDRGKFIPHPATWLNQRRWDDEVRTVVGNGAQPEGPITRMKREIAEEQSGKQGHEGESHGPDESDIPF